VRIVHNEDHLNVGWLSMWFSIDKNEKLFQAIFYERARPITQGLCILLMLISISTISLTLYLSSEIGLLEVVLILFFIAIISTEAVCLTLITLKVRRVPILPERDQTYE